MAISVNHSTKPLYKKASGIYVITNTVNGKRYIGSAVNFTKRWAVHRHQLNLWKHGNTHLQAAWNKYGADSFSFERLILCSAGDLLFYEQLFIDEFDPEYNKRSIASSNLGWKPTLEARRKMSDFQKTRRHSEETKAKIAALKTGLRHTPEAKEKMRAAKLGKPSNKRGIPNSPEARAKISAALKGRKSPRAKAVEIAGTVHESAAKAAIAVGVTASALCAMLRGQNANRLNARYAP